ncbi:hypothetical protein PRIC1_013672 [Phytophthora ramorum]
MQSRRTVRIWDRVQPSLWHPLASLEQSLMDVEVMARRVFSPHFPTFAPFASNAMAEVYDSDDEFFKDLPIKRPEQQTKAVGHRIGTARRRYEDSTARLKATHEREIDGKKVKMLWQRSNTQDEGGHETICSSGSPEEFEKEWTDTPLGRAEDEELAKWMEERERSVYVAFGIEYKPAMEPKVKQNDTTPEERKVVEEGGKETIQEISKRRRRPRSSCREAADQA